MGLFSKPTPEEQEEIERQEAEEEREYQNEINGIVDEKVSSLTNEQLIMSALHTLLVRSEDDTEVSRELRKRLNK